MWTFLGSILQIISRFNFEKACFLDNLVFRLASEYSSILIYPFQLTYECFIEKNPNTTGFTRSLIQQILDAIENPFLQDFLDSLKCINLPEKVLQHHMFYFIHRETHSKPKQQHQQLKAIYDNVFENPKRGKLSDHIQSIKKDFLELMTMFGMLKFSFIF